MGNKTEIKYETKTETNKKGQSVDVTAPVDCDPQLREKYAEYRKCGGDKKWLEWLMIGGRSYGRDKGHPGEQDYREHARKKEERYKAGKPRHVYAKVCTNCGNEFHHDSKFCRVCGKGRKGVLVAGKK